MQLHEFWQLVNETQKNNPSWRYGQTAFNVLSDTRPDLLERIRGSVSDPFYVKILDQNNMKWKNFVNFLDNNWSCPDCGAVPVHGICNCRDNHQDDSTEV